MTRPELEAIKSKPHGPDVDRLIQEIEDCWTKLSDLGERETISVWPEPSHDLLVQMEGKPDRLITVEEQKAAIRKFVL